MTDSETTDAKADSETTAVAILAARPVREVRVVESISPIMDTARFEHLGRVATVMARAGLMPESLTHYKDAKGDMIPHEFEVVQARAFLIANQADLWKADPNAVAQCASLVYGKLMFEGKLVHGLIETRLGIRLKYEFGKFDPNLRDIDPAIMPGATDPSLGVRVTGKFDDEDEVRWIAGSVEMWHKGPKSPWNSPSAWPRMLRYMGSREWSRAHSSGLILGIMTDDEIDQTEERQERRASRRSLSAPNGSPVEPPEGKNLGAAHGERTAASVDKPNGGLADSAQFTNPGPASDTKVGPKATRTADKGPAAQTAAEPEKPASDAQAGAGEGSGDDGAKASEVDDDAKIEQPAAVATVKDEDPGEDEDVEEAFQASDEDEDEDDGTDLSEADAAEVEATDEADGTEPMIPGELTAFHITMTDARKWDDVLTALNELCRSAWWKAATVDQQDEALASAWSYIAALIDEGIDIPSHRKNPGVFRLWSLNQTDDKVVEGAWSDLATTSTYSKMPEGGRNALIKDKQRVLAKLRAANA